MAWNTRKRVPPVGWPFAAEVMVLTKVGLLYFFYCRGWIVDRG
jgi:hypothetical protein